jgi:ribonuclease Z
MKPTFHHRLVNNCYEDPCLFVRMVREKRAFLFDAGHIDRLRSGDLMKITDLFVTHTHIDHFIGFDTLLRALLRRDVPLRVYGPENITDCVEGKLAGYTWNLIKEYPISIEVFSLTKREIIHTSFSAENSFKRTAHGSTPYEGIVLREPPYTVKAAILSHGIPCLGYSLDEDYHINIDKSALTVRGLPVGPWLADFKRMIRDKADPETRLTINGRELVFSDLMPLAAITEGQKISYLTDISPEEENISMAIDLVRDSDTLYCEAYFLHEDIQRAFERSHLTAKIAGVIARKATVKNLMLMHFSPKYKDRMDALETEAMQEFRGQ